jgi:hypothetical protein
MMLLVPLYWLFPNSPDLNVHLGLTLLVLANVLTAVPLYTLLGRVLDEATALVAVVSWLFNPWVVAISLSGVEVALYVFFVSLTVQLYMEYRATAQPFETPRLIALALSMGLTILARTDGVFLFLAILTDMLLHQRHTLHKASGSLATRKKLEVAMFLVITGLVLLPWVLWNLASFGTVVQTSGAAISYHTHLALKQARSWQEVVLFLYRSSWMMFTTVVFMILQWNLVLLSLLLVRSFSPYRRHVGQGKGDWFVRIRPFSFLLFYAFLLFAFYAWYLLQRQMWYFLAIVFSLTMIMAVLYHIFTKEIAQQEPLFRWLVRGATVGFFLATFSLSVWAWESQGIAMYPAQLDGYKLSQWLSTETEPHARIGAWNSGIIGYYSHRTVVNLDGVVNNRLLRYITFRHTSADMNGLWNYVQEMHIDYLTDYEDVFSASLEETPGRALRQVYAFPSTYSHQYYVRVFRILCREQHTPLQVIEGGP